MLKKYSLICGSPKVLSPTEVFGYVKLQKEHQDYIITIVLNSPAVATAYAVVNADVLAIDLQPGKVNSATYNLKSVNIFCVVIPQLGLFACNKNEQLSYGYNLASTYILASKRQERQKADRVDGIESVQGNAKIEQDIVQSRAQNPANNLVAEDFNNRFQAFCSNNCVHITPLENVFKQPVLATDFFDAIKHKLAKLFAMGSPCQQLNCTYKTSRWVKLDASQGQNVVGVIYYVGYPFAVGVGKLCQENKYDIKFFSAANGKVLNMPTV